MKKLICAAVAGSFAFVGTASANVIFADDFEAYNDNADVIATAEWTEFTLDAELVTDEEAFSGTNAIKEPETAGSLLGGHTPVFAADIDADTPLVVTFAYFDSDEEVGSEGIGLRTGLSYGSYTGGSFASGDLINFFAMGVHHPDDQWHYAGRVVFGGSGWTVFDGEGDTAEIPRATGWHEMQVRIYPDEVEFYVDGILGATDTYTEVTEWNSMRLGAFAGTAQSLDIYFDDISVVLGLDEVSVDDWHMF